MAIYDLNRSRRECYTTPSIKREGGKRTRIFNNLDRRIRRRQLEQSTGSPLPQDDKKAFSGSSAKERPPVFIHPDGYEPMIIQAIEHPPQSFPEYLPERIEFLICTSEGINHSHPVLMGDACLLINGNGTLTLGRFKIAGLFQNIGIGSRLMEEVIKVAQELNMPWGTTYFRHEYKETNQTSAIRFFGKYFRSVLPTGRGIAVRWPGYLCD